MKVWHMSGAGNDFMVMDARGRHLDFSALAVSLCRKTHADGFMAVDDPSRGGDFRLHFYNSDGSRGEMCGNGSRCVCRFAWENHIAGDSMVVETDAGLVPGWRLGENRYRVKLNNPGTLRLSHLPGVHYVELGDPGVPHGLVELWSLAWEQKEQLRDRAVALRHDPAFPKGANISFYAWLSPQRVRVLTFERGVEDYTLACGTGCGSIAAALWTENRLPGGHLTCQNMGGSLELEVSGENGEVTSLLLTGPADILKIYDCDI